jgi:chaperonin GroES
MAEEEVKNLTALEKKWLENEQNKPSSIDDAYDEQGQFDPTLIPEEAISRIPRPTGWRVAILPYRGAERTKSGIVIAEETQKRTQLATNCGYVISLGDLAYKDETKFPFGAWCKEGDWIIFGRYAGSRISIDGGEIRFLNDDEILGIVNSPEDILHM